MACHLARLKSVADPASSVKRKGNWASRGAPLGCGAKGGAARHIHSSRLPPPPTGPKTSPTGTPS
eukprot:9174441-Alexandrium_andersonii.AAC.1